MNDAVRPGRPFPLGVHLTRSGGNVAVYSSVADAVELCLFDGQGRETRMQLPGHDDGIWHGFVPGLVPGQRYGFRVHGPWDPSSGLRCNPNSLLLDPYARAISGEVTFEAAAYGFEPSEPDRPNSADSASVMPRSVVVESFDPVDADARPGHHLNDSVIYEMHVKGFTARHPDVPTELRGTSPAWHTRWWSTICAACGSPRSSSSRCSSRCPSRSCFSAG